jgi:flap endonuclease-1
VVQAPSEGEAQAAHMARRGDVWAAASKDYDTILFGAPRLLRFLGVSGKEYLPSQGRFRPLAPELLDLEEQLASWQISRESLIDLALLVGTDFNEGVHGIGPKKALALVQKFGSIEAMPSDIRERVGDTAKLRRIYLEPVVTDDYTVSFGQADPDAIVRFLCEDRQFDRVRVMDALARARLVTGQESVSESGRLF